jgi:hypothetical protein
MYKIIILYYYIPMSDIEIIEYNFKTGKYGNYVQITLNDGSNKNISLSTELKKIVTKENITENIVDYLYEIQFLKDKIRELVDRIKEEATQEINF